MTKDHDGSKIIPKEDIGEVAVPEGNDDTVGELKKAQIIAVPQLAKYRSCLRCNARVEPSTTEVGQCSRLECKMLQKLEHCSEQISTKLLVVADSKIESLSEFGKIVQQLANVTSDAEVTEEALLNCAQLSSVKYNDRNVIVSITK